MPLRWKRGSARRPGSFVWAPIPFIAAFIGLAVTDRRWLHCLAANAFFVMPLAMYLGRGTVG